MSELKEKTGSIDQVENDKLLEMFLDKDFVPQAYIDILFSNTSANDLTQMQAMSSALLARFDYYTKSLTRELKTSIESLEKLSETIPSTWSSTPVSLDSSTISQNQVNTLGSSKLEYYLDTLGSAVRALETDTNKIDEQIKELNVKYNSSDDVVEQLDTLVRVRNRLKGVVKCFEELKTIFSISNNSDETKGTDSGVSLTDFKISLQTLEETIEESLINSSQNEKRNVRNIELLKKIDHFIELKPVFKGLDNFYSIYSDFIDSISRKKDIYLSTKDIEGEFK